MKINFNVAEKIAAIEEQAKTFEPIPEGIYTVRIEEVTDKETRNGGIMINIKERVVDGQFKNRVVFQKINIVCPTSEIAERIGKETFAKIAFAAGVPNIKDTAQITNKIISVKVIQTEFNGRIQNEVKSVVMPKKQPAQTEVIEATEAQIETTDDGNFAF